MINVSKLGFKARQRPGTQNIPGKQAGKPAAVTLGNT